MRRAAAALVAVLLAACTPTAPTTPATSTTPSSGIVNVGLQRLTDASPLRSEDAAIGIAFDDAAAVALVAEPPAIDYASRALLCLALGARATGGWSVTIQSISLDGDRMSIRAREVRPRPGAGSTQGATYPADCALIDRTVLPAGALMVRADDTISDEFIVDATIEVPAR